MLFFTNQTCFLTKSRKNIYRNKTSSTHLKNFIRICIHVDIVVISLKFVYEADLKFRAMIGF